MTLTEGIVSVDDLYRWRYSSPESESEGGGEGEVALGVGLWGTLGFAEDFSEGLLPFSPALSDGEGEGSRDTSRSGWLVGVLVGLCFFSSVPPFLCNTSL